MSRIQSLIALGRETKAAPWTDTKTICPQSGILSEDTCILGFPPLSKVTIVERARATD